LTAAEVLRRASETGLTVSVRGYDHIVVRGRGHAIEALKAELAAHKPEIIAVLRLGGGRTASEAVLSAQRLLREGRWPKTAPKDCGFFIGRPDVDQVCRRCDSSWHEHTIRAMGGER
jgi:hypothetical protein